jgi:hypothetical protein
VLEQRVGRQLEVPVRTHVALRTKKKKKTIKLK